MFKFLNSLFSHFVSSDCKAKGGGMHGRGVHGIGLHGGGLRAAWRSVEGCMAAANMAADCMALGNYLQGSGQQTSWLKAVG